MSYVVFDFGGTKTRVARSADLVTLDEVTSFTTPPSFAAAMKRFVEAIESLGVTEVAGVAGGIRGVINETRTGIDNDNVLTGWAGKSIADAVHARFPNVPFVLENDTAVAGLGEAHFGAGKGYPIVAYHTISTGVGGVRIEAGQIDAASFGFEPGHQLLDIDSPILGAEVTPTLENLVSGTAVGDRY